MEEYLEERIKYTQPHNIKVPFYMTDVLADRYREYEHNRQKHEARNRQKYLRSKWTKILYG